jgi:hypothetical protein
MIFTATSENVNLECVTFLIKYNMSIFLLEGLALNLHTYDFISQEIHATKCMKY